MDNNPNSAAGHNSLLQKQVVQPGTAEARLTAQLKPEEIVRTPDGAVDHIQIALNEMFKNAGGRTVETMDMPPPRKPTKTGFYNFVCPVILILAAPFGLFLAWVFWSLIWEVIVFVFGKHWKVFLCFVGAYIIGLEIYERMNRRKPK